MPNSDLELWRLTVDEFLERQKLSGVDDEPRPAEATNARIQFGEIDFENDEPPDEDTVRRSMLTDANKQ